MPGILLFLTLISAAFPQPITAQTLKSAELSSPGTWAFDGEIIEFSLRVMGDSDYRNLEFEIDASGGEFELYNRKGEFGIYYDYEEEGSVEFSDITVYLQVTEFGDSPVNLKMEIFNRNRPEHRILSNALSLRIHPFPEDAELPGGFLFSEEPEAYTGQLVMIYPFVLQTRQDFIPLPGAGSYPEPENMERVSGGTRRFMLIDDQLCSLDLLPPLLYIPEEPGHQVLNPEGPVLPFGSDSGIFKNPLTLNISSVPPRSGIQSYALGRSLTASLQDYPERLERDQAISFTVRLKGDANLEDLKSLKPFSDRLASFEERVVLRERQMDRDRPVSVLEFSYTLEKPGLISSFFGLPKGRVMIPLFQTEEKGWSTTELLIPGVHGTLPFLAMIPYLAALAAAVFSVFLLIKAAGKISLTGFTRSSEDKAEMDDAMKLHHIKKQYGLTPREGEVLEALKSGQTNTDLAEALCISPETSKKHIKNIMEKTATHSRYELFVLCHNFSPDEEKSAKQS